MGVDGLDISSYRQIAITISQRYCRQDWFEDEKSKLTSISVPKIRSTAHKLQKS